MANTPFYYRNWLAKYTHKSGSSSSSEQEKRAAIAEAQELVLASSPTDIVPQRTTSASTGESPTSTLSSNRWSASPLLTNSASKSPSTIQDLDQQASQLILNALERSNSAQPQLKPPEMNARSSGSFSKMSFSSMMGGLSALSLSRSGTHTSSYGDEKESRGRSILHDKSTRSSSATLAPDNDTSRSHSRARSQSPFYLRRFRSRDTSPTPQPLPLTHNDVDLSDSTAFADDPDSGDETVGETDADTDDEDWSLDDPLTERNTERNAFIMAPNTSGVEGDDVDIDPDPLGEGVNVIVPPEPYFPSTLNTYSSSGGSGSLKGKRNPRRRKTTRHEVLPIHNSRPNFQRDRCTIVITNGDPDEKLGERRRRKYIVASDLSDESRYAMEWGIGTVLRDGDEMLIVTVVENEGKVDPPIPNPAERAVKLRSQQERQGLAYILVRQATSLLQRTKLHVRVSCQAWHAKNARHMLLDIVDYHEPTMLIVGSRGLGRLKGILLGSTSHYLIQKCSVPVMVARRRLKRPPRRSAHLSNHRAHVSLAEAGIDRVVPKVDRAVKTMNDEIEMDHESVDGVGANRDGAVDEEKGEEEEDEPEENGHVKDQVSG